ncbi:leucine-rich repeat-containing protein 14 [Polyodon spathula]|uniref:leucine-rich repeat-containing protein 14 n=1 Tax=Polyodon spathula TaxID=7913 RepID=UPI001B7DB35D|nr:leucine-rich repeat-containing protein 14 [Polyodon spathula]XP_041100533.1 leucine-rich repeat-containing protein 14 [Polyodon spathula]
MPASLVFLCARKVASDHGCALRSLASLPQELYPVLFKAAFLDQRPLVIGELVLRWPERVLSLTRSLRACQHCRLDLSRDWSSRDCLQAVLLAVVKGLRERDKRERNALRVLDLCGVQDEGGRRMPNTMGSWFRTVALSKACLEARGRRGARESTPKRRRGVSSPAVEVEVRADLFVNASSFETVRQALRGGGPLRLVCRDLRAEELSTQRTASLLDMLEPTSLRRVDLRYNNLGLAGIALLLPRLASCPSLLSLRLLYSNVDVHRPTPGMEAGLRELAGGLGGLLNLREINLTSLRLSGKLRLLLSALERPLEVLELPYFSLTPSDLSYLSSSPHAPALRKLDLSGNSLSVEQLPSLQRLLSVSRCLSHLVLSGCSLTDSLLGALLPSLGLCRGLQSLGLSLNPLSTRGLLSLAHTATGLPHLQLLVYPQPTDCYEEGLPQPPSYYNLMEFPLDQGKLARATEELRMVLERAGRADLVLSTDLYSHSTAELLEE